ncbi:MAG: oatA 2 [Mycobacterium sp.]|nr:oatA 2 [Mycobacterium sp.]
MTTQPAERRRAPSVGAAPRTRGRIIGLDGARGLSCLGVAVAHITGHFTPETAAAYKTNLVGISLIFFYVLSGFLLFLPYVRNLTQPRALAGLPSTKNFALHRIARILPGYLVIFLLVNFVFQVAYVQNPATVTPGTDEGTGMITDPWQLLANLTLVHTYIPQYFQTGLNPSWSLTLEYAFYFFLPLLGALLFTMRRRTGIRPLTVAFYGALVFVAVGFVGRLLMPLVNAKSGVTDFNLLEWGPNWAAVYSKSFLTNADNFAAGMLAAIVVVAMEQKSITERLSKRVRLLSVVAMGAVLVIGAQLLALQSPFATAALGMACGILILVIVAPLARGEDSTIARYLDLPPVRFVGRVSLSAYLWHFPVMLVLGRWGLMAGDTLPGMLRNVTLVLAVTLVISTLTYYLVEEPIMNAAKRYRHRWA